MKQSIESNSSAARNRGPAYYKNQSIQPWDVADTMPYPQRIGYYKMSAIAYLMRLGNKDGTEEITEVDKAIHYLEKLKEVIQEEQAND